MGENQKRFKSSVYRMNIDKMKKTTRSQLRKGNRPWEGRLWEIHQATNRNLIRGRQGGMSWHNTAKSRHSALEVNEALGWRRFSSLPGEILSALRHGQLWSAWRSNTSGDRKEVSRSHSTEIMNRGAERCSFKQCNSQAQLRKGRTNIGEPTSAPFRSLKLPIGSESTKIGRRQRKRVPVDTLYSSVTYPSRISVKKATSGVLEPPCYGSV